MGEGSVVGSTVAVGVGVGFALLRELSIASMRTKVVYLLSAV